MKSCLGMMNTLFGPGFGNFNEYRFQYPQKLGNHDFQDESQRYTCHVDIERRQDNTQKRLTNYFELLFGETG